jgi:uncharacterized protein (DUF427 family)
MTITATWNGAVLAKSDDTVVVEGNHYFGPDDVDMTFLKDSSHHSVCGWKGTASYYDVVVDGQRNANAAWFYPETKPDADLVRGRIAFWHGVDVS